MGVPTVHVARSALKHQAPDPLNSAPPIPALVAALPPVPDKPLPNNHHNVPSYFNSCPHRDNDTGLWASSSLISSNNNSLTNGDLADGRTVQIFHQLSTDRLDGAVWDGDEERSLLSEPGRSPILGDTMHPSDWMQVTRCPSSSPSSSSFSGLSPLRGLHQLNNHQTLKRTTECEEPELSTPRLSGLIITNQRSYLTTALGPCVSCFPVSYTHLTLPTTPYV